MNKVVKNISRAICLLIVTALGVSMLGCSHSVPSYKVSIYPAASVKVHETVTEEEKLHFTDNSALTSALLNSGLLSLYLDKTSYSVVIRESSAKKNWYTLPLADSTTEGDCDASTVTLEVVRGADTYYLNSQDNSVAYGTASYGLVTPEGEKNSSVEIKYIISTDQITANKKEFATSDIAFEVRLVYTLKDGNLYISSTYKNLSGNSDAFIENMGVLEYFGAGHTASSTDTERDFILVLDGCGALIYTDTADDDFVPVELAVYGEDYSNGAGKGKNSAQIAAYGARQGSSAFAAIIEKGDAIATIKADKQGGETDFNTVGASFNITPVMRNNYGENIKQYTTADSYDEEIRFCFKFFSGSSASYSAMAVACREQLIRNGVLSTKSVDDSAGTLPFNITMMGAAQGGKLNRLQSLTTFSEAIDMLEQAKAKSIDNINIRYTGAFTGGTNQASVFKSGVLSELGGKSDLQRLYEYTSSKKMGLYLDVNLLTANRSNAFGGSKTATAITGDETYGLFDNKLCGYLGGQEKFNRSFLKLTKLEDSVIELFNKTRNMKFTGFCLNDCSNLLYSDYSEEAVNRQTASEELFEQLIPLSTNKKIMVDTGNFYALRGADTIVNMPLTTQLEETENYVAIPFLQMILHGTADYSGTPINEADDADYAALKYIEYGACPSYEWCYRELAEGTSLFDTYYYSEWLNSAVKFYQKANEALSDLRASRIVNHYMLEPGFYCTEYSDGEMIYVNYNDTDKEINGLTVGAEDFLRIN